MSHSKIFEDLGYEALAEVKEHSVEFTVYVQDTYDAELDPFMIGYVKWDGCSNWHYPDAHYPLHFCELSDIDKHKQLFIELYRWAAELLPEHTENII